MRFMSDLISSIAPPPHTELLPLAPPPLALMPPPGTEVVSTTTDAGGFDLRLDVYPLDHDIGHSSASLLDDCYYEEEDDNEDEQDPCVQFSAGIDIDLDKFTSLGMDTSLTDHVTGPLRPPEVPVDQTSAALRSFVSDFGLQCRNEFVDGEY